MVSDLEFVTHRQIYSRTLHKQKLKTQVNEMGLNEEKRIKIYLDGELPI